MKRALQALLNALGLAGGYLLLTAGDERLSGQPESRFDRAWLGVLLLSLVVGLAQVGLWMAAWQYFGEPTGVPIMPALAAAAIPLLWTHRRAMSELIDVLCPRAAGRSVVAAFLTAGLVLAMLNLSADSYMSETALPWSVAWIRPWREKVYRVLLLMPLWGAWAMMIVVQFGKPKGRCSGAFRRYAKGTGPLTTALLMGLLLAVTITYFNYLPWQQLAIPMVTIATAIAAGIGLRVRQGRLRRSTILAVNMLTQVVFLLTYLVVRNHWLWR
ncbi:MAG: hypothetical protein ACLFVU_12645 [Phycisphaerae bacterium]